MRLLGVVFAVYVVYVGVPLLWKYAMVAKVDQLSKTPPAIPVTAAIPTLDANLINAVNPTVEINTEEYERIAIQSQADQAVRQAQDAQDMAWQAEHPDMH